MRNATEQGLNYLVREQFERNKDILLEAVMRGCEEKDSYHEIYAKMLINSMEISAEISTKVILEMLLKLGIVDEKDEREIMRNVLRVVKAQDDR